MANLINTICKNPTVDIYWGCDAYAMKIGRNVLTTAYSVAKAWFKENSHYFHLENFPPTQRMREDEDGIVEIDYGSHEHFVYCIPIVR